MDNPNEKEQSATKQEPIIRIEGHKRIHIIPMWEGHEHENIPVHIEIKMDEGLKKFDIKIKP